MPQNIYDNPEFFAGYDHLRETGAGINEALEQPAIRSLLPDVRGMRVLDMGCGAGEMCRLLIEKGAKSRDRHGCVRTHARKGEVARSDRNHIYTYTG